MSVLDIRTLSFLATVSSLLLALGLLLVRRIAPDDPSLRLWVIGASASSMGYVLLAMRDMVPHFLSIIVANTLIVLGSTYYFLGNRSFRGLRAGIGYYWVPAAAIAISFTYFTYVTPDLAMRIILISILLALLRFFCAAELLRAGGTRDRFVRWLAAAAFLSTALILGTRSVVTAYLDPVGQNFMALTSPVQTLALAFEASLQFVLGMSLPILLLGRAQRNLGESEEKFHSLYSAMAEGVALHELVLDESGKPVDYVLLDVNPAYESILGLSAQAVLGRRASQVYGEVPYLEAYAGVVATGEPAHFEATYAPMAKTFVISALPAESRFATVFRDITQRKLDDERLKASLAEKEVMMREIHHRVKNNLQTINALLNLQSRRVKDEQARIQFSNSQRRIESMAMVHTALYRSGDFTQIDFAAYLRSLVDHLRGQFDFSAERVRIRVEAQACSLPVDTAIPCGMVLTELASNAMKHAFPGRSAGELRVILRNGGDGKVVLEVADDGVGLPAEPTSAEGGGFGMRLVRLMVEDQLQGKLSIESGHGTRVVCEIGVKT